MGNFVREHRRTLCPECMEHGALQGMAGANWMECKNGHSWGYRETGDKTTEER